MSQEETQVESAAEVNSSTVVEKQSAEINCADTNTDTKADDVVDTVLLPKINVWHLRQQHQPTAAAATVMVPPVVVDGGEEASWPTLADQQQQQQPQPAGSASPSSTSSQQPPAGGAPAKGRWVPLKLDIHYAHSGSATNGSGQKGGKKSSGPRQDSQGQQQQQQGNANNSGKNRSTNQQQISNGQKSGQQSQQSRGSQPQQNRRSQSYQRNGRQNQQQQQQQTRNSNADGAQKVDEAPAVSVTSPPASPGANKPEAVAIPDSANDSQQKPSSESNNLQTDANASAAVNKHSAGHSRPTQPHHYNHYQNQSGRSSAYKGGYQQKFSGSRNGASGTMRNQSQHYGGGKKYGSGTYYSTYPQQPSHFPPHQYYPSPTPSSASSSTEFQPPFIAAGVPQQPMFFQPPPPPMYPDLAADPAAAQFILLQQQQQQQQPPTVLSFIQHQVEFYFSPENLCKDVYFRSQMNGEGFVSVQLIAGFNRVRSMSGGDLQMLRAALAQSSILELGPFEGVEGMGVRLAGDEWTRWLLPPKSESQEQESSAAATA